MMLRPLAEGETSIFVMSLTTTKGMVDFWTVHTGAGFLDRPMREQIRTYDPAPPPDMLLRDWLQTIEITHIGEVQKRWVNGRLVCRLNSLERLDRTGWGGHDVIWAADYSRFDTWLSSQRNIIL